MIDLSIALPDTVTVDGKAYLIKTDFREWLKFNQIVQEENATLADLVFLFKGSIPTSDFSQPLLDFFVNDNKVPNYKDVGDDRVLDYLIDGEYIYASFMAEYGIDLIDIEYLHWHKFKALLIGLSDESKIKQIMGMRAYKKSNKTPDKIAQENKKAWELPKNYDKEIIEEIQKAFG